MREASSRSDSLLGLACRSEQVSIAVGPLGGTCKQYVKAACHITVHLYACYDLRLKLIRLQMIEYLVVHVGTF